MTVGPLGAISAPDWGLGQQGRGAGPADNQFSILDARSYQLRSLAEPGQILASRTVRDLVVGSDIAMDDLGTRPLKGVDGTWQLFAARP